MMQAEMKNQRQRLVIGINHTAGAAAAAATWAKKHCPQRSCKLFDFG